jgi:hypothetical protein
MASSTAAGARLGGGRKAGKSQNVFPATNAGAESSPARQMERARQRCHSDRRPGTELTGGSLFTRECAKNLDRPCLHVYPSSEWREWIRTFLKTNSIRILNVAGPRNSSAKNLQPFVHEVLDEAHMVC